MVVNPNTDQLVGHVLAGRYRLVELVAQGGMAVVYRGHDLQLDRSVAVKVPHPQFASDASFAAQFDREGRAAARLNHPAIVAVHDSGQDGSIPYIVMEYVDGQSLRQFLKRYGPLDLETTADVVGSVAAALDHAHTRDVAHLDIKPENVLLTHGSIKVVDFGLVRALRTMAPHAVAGTEAYLAPEVRRGEAVSESADIYALGVMAIECLTGAVPSMSARGNKAAIALAQFPETVQDALAGATDAIVSHRPQRAIDVATALGARRRQFPGDPTATRSSGTTSVMGTSVLGTTVLEGDNASTALLARGDVARASNAVTTPGRMPSTRVAAPRAPVPTHPSSLRARPTLRQSSQRQRPAARGRRRGWQRGTLFVALVLLVLAAVTFVATQTVATNTRTIVPRVLGLSASAARQSLGAAQLHAVQGSPVYSFLVSAGDVARQSPPAGTRLGRRAAVVFVVSEGPPPATVPSVIGDTALVARRALVNARLRVVVRYRPNRTVRANTVSGQLPAAGSAVPQATIVTVTLSSGPARVHVPFVVGLSRKRALRALRHAGLHGSFGLFSFGQTVTAQSPAAGNLLPQGGHVHLTTSVLP